jgi:hypothetical protein
MSLNRENSPESANDSINNRTCCGSIVVDVSILRDLHNSNLTHSFSLKTTVDILKCFTQLINLNYKPVNHLLKTLISTEQKSIGITATH